MTVVDIRHRASARTGVKWHPVILSIFLCKGNHSRVVTMVIGSVGARASPLPLPPLTLPDSTESLVPILLLGEQSKVISDSVMTGGHAYNACALTSAQSHLSYCYTRTNHKCHAFYTSTCTNELFLAPSKQFELAFKMFDENGDGNLDQEEYEKVNFRDHVS